MMIKTTTIEIYPGVGYAVQNVTHFVNEFILDTGIRNGLLIALYKHTTGSIIIGEHEVGVIADIKRCLELLAPENDTYLHHNREVDFNGFAHVRAAIMPTSVVIPIQDGNLVLGTHQEVQIIDNQPEELPRFLFLQVIGE